ncbi:MAG: CdaR family protein, partial [Bacillota bacterium]
MGRMFFDDRVVWAVSILLAVVLWIQVTGARAQDVQQTFTELPVQWRDLPETMSVLDMQPARVDITLRGMRDVMQQLSREDFIATVSLTGGQPGSVDYYVTVSVPRGVQLVQVTPETVAVTLERSLEEVYPVDV